MFEWFCFIELVGEESRLNIVFATASENIPLEIVLMLFADTFVDMYLVCTLSMVWRTYVIQGKLRACVLALEMVVLWAMRKPNQFVFQKVRPKTQKRDVKMMRQNKSFTSIKHAVTFLSTLTPEQSHWLG